MEGKKGQRYFRKSANLPVANDVGWDHDHDRFHFQKLVTQHGRNKCDCLRRVQQREVREKLTNEKLQRIDELNNQPANPRLIIIKFSNC
jgi:hypothetical protein